MSNLQIIEELCRICEAQSYIIKAQAGALEQLGAVVMEEERADVGRALTAMIGHDEAPDLQQTDRSRFGGGPLHEGSMNMNVFYFCNGQDETCSKEGCHKNGGNCHHTVDPAFARETEGTRWFEELQPGELFEIEPDKGAD